MHPVDRDHLLMVVSMTILSLAGALMLLWSWI